MNVLLARLDKKMFSAGLALSNVQAHATSYRDVIAQGGLQQPASQAAPLTAAQQQVLPDSLDALLALSATLQRTVAPTEFQVMPEPDPRIRPAP